MPWLAAAFFGGNSISANSVSVIRVEMDLARKLSPARGDGTAGGTTEGGLVSGEDISQSP